MIPNQKKSITPRLSTKPSMRFLRSTSYPLERDLFNIAVAVFKAERLARSGERRLNLTVPLSLAAHESLNLPSVAACMEDALTAIYPIPVSIEFKISDTRQLKVKEGSVADADAVVLFSGGVDSLAAILNIPARFSRIAALFVAHSDQGGLVQIVNRLAAQVLADRGIQLQTLYAPAIGSHGYSQTRGFLYLMCGILFAHASHAKALIVGETGPTMYQPQFGPFDVVTMTSHPIIMRAGAIIAAGLPRPIRILTPFEDLTKAETIASIGQAGKHYMPLTHSCISQRFRDHDGTCYGCVIRRLAALAVGFPDVPYKKDVLADDSARVGNLLPLLRFSHDLVTDPESLPVFSRVMIDEYGKLDLFRRFAADTFAGLYAYREAGGRFSGRVLKALTAYLSLEELSQFRGRMEKLRRGAKKPDYGPGSTVSVRL